MRQTMNHEINSQGNELVSLSPPNYSSPEQELAQADFGWRDGVISFEHEARRLITF